MKNIAKAYTGDIAIMQCENCGEMIKGRLYLQEYYNRYFLEFECPSCNNEQENIDKVKEFISELFDRDNVPSCLEDKLREILEQDDLENLKFTVSYDDLIENYKLGGLGEFIEGNDLIRCNNCELQIPRENAEEGGYWENSPDYHAPDEFVPSGYFYCCSKCEEEHQKW